MANNGKDIKHTGNISRIINFVINGEECNFQKKVWCEVGLQLTDIGTKNVREYELYHILGYPMVILDNRQNTFTVGVIGCRRV